MAAQRVVLKAEWRAASKAYCLVGPKVAGMVVARAGPKADNWAAQMVGYLAEMKVEYWAVQMGK
jgi:hypothetical protein